MEILTRNIRLTLPALFVLLSLAYSENDDSLNTPFEKIVVVKNKDGTIEKKLATGVKKSSEGYEIQKAEGGVALFPLKSVVAIVPQYPKKGLQYGLEDVRIALKNLRSLPAEYALTPDEIKKWEVMEEILSAANPNSQSTSRSENKSETPVSVSNEAVSREMPVSGISLKNVMTAEELYQACSGPFGKEFLGKSVVIEGIVDGIDQPTALQDLTQPKKIRLRGAPRASGGWYPVSCEIRGPVTFVFQDGNLYVRYFRYDQVQASKRKEIKPVFFTFDGQSIEGDAGNIIANLEVPLINRGNRLQIAQRMKIVGFNAMKDLELTGANIQKSPLSQDEIEHLGGSIRSNHSISGGRRDGGEYRLEKLFVELDN